MRTAGIAFAAGLGGTLSGFLLAGLLGAAQARNDTAGDGTAPEARAAETVGDEGRETPRLALTQPPVIEGPATRIVYREEGRVLTVEDPDMFVWVYPEWVIAGPLADEHVTVLPRETVVAIRMFDVSPSPRQTYREQAQRLRREGEPEREGTKPAPASP